MFKEDLFYLKDIIISPEKDNASVIVKLNAEHNIFSGHFPDNPILPGVCIVQMIKEILSEIIKKDVMLVKSNSIKFLNLINPLQNQIINFDFKIRNIDENNIHVSCQIYFESTNFCNLKGEFVVIV